MIHNCFPNLSQREQEVIKLYKTNLTLLEIAQGLGIGETTLRNTIKKLGLKRTPRFKYKGCDKKKILELYNLGLSEPVISKKLGISLSTLRVFKKKLGIIHTSPELKLMYQKRVEKRKYNKKQGISAECPNKTNILEKYYDDIVRLLKHGVSKTEIARRYNVCTHTVFNFINLFGIKAPQIKKCDHKEKEIILAYQANISQREIARQIHCSKATLISKVNDLQLKRNRFDVKKKSPLNDQEELIKKLYAQGLSGDEIAKQVHVHPISVYNKIRKMKLKRPQKWATYRCTFTGRDKELLKLRQSGMTLKELGKHFHVCSTSVLYRLKKLEETSA